MVMRRRHTVELVYGHHQSLRRHFSSSASGRMAASRSQVAHRHPLAPKDPATRNIAVPQSFHAKKGTEGALTAEELQKRAQRALLLHMQQDVLWEGTVIDSTEHKLVQHFIKLARNPKYRQARQLLLVGGKELIRELCENGLGQPKHLLVTEGKEVPQWARQHKGLEIVRVKRDVSSQCVPGNDGYVGDFEIPAPPPKEELIANKRRMGRVLVLDNVDDAGTLGTILRTAAGFQYDAIIATNHCADLYDNRVIRAARGAHFQSAVPIYTLKEEDGDDVYGMINHVIDRNNLQPVCFAAHEDEQRSSVKCPVVGASYPTHVPQPKAARRAELSDFCMNLFAGDSEETTQGIMVFAGPNHKRNMMQRLEQCVARNTTQLLLDEIPTTDMLVSLSVVLHALRPSGSWDYLPLAKQSEPSTMDLQMRSASVDIGPNRLVMNESCLSMDEEEQRREADLANEFMKWRRLNKRRKSDYEFWMGAETDRVKHMLRQERRRASAPWKADGPGRNPRSMPDWVPNIIDEYRMPLNRDALREERENSETHVRPNNYTR